MSYDAGQRARDFAACSGAYTPTPTPTPTQSTYTPVWWAAEYAAYQKALSNPSRGGRPGLNCEHAGGIIAQMNERRRLEEIPIKAAAEKARRQREADEKRAAFLLTPEGVAEVKVWEARKLILAEEKRLAELPPRERLIELKMVELRKKEEEAEIEAEARRRLAALVPRERLIELKMAELRKKEEEAEIEAEAISRLGLAAIFTP